MAADLSLVERLQQDAIPKSRGVLVAVATLLLCAASLKAYGLWRGGTSSAVPFSSPHWQLAIIELEAALGLWFISGRGERAAWHAASLAFVAFAGVSAFLALSGYRTCACFGPVQVNPWLTFAIDAAALAALWRVRPQGAFGSNSRRAILLGGCAVAVALIGAQMLAVDGALSTAVSRWRGDSFSVEPRVSHLGEGNSGEWRSVPVRIHNRRGVPLRIVGLKVGCLVELGTELPVAVHAGSSVDIVLMCKFPAMPQDFSATLTLFTDDERQFELPVNVVGTSVEPPSLDP